MNDEHRRWTMMPTQAGENPVLGLSQWANDGSCEVAAMGQARPVVGFSPLG
jgi:hypothetical protein